MRLDAAHPSETPEGIFIALRPAGIMARSIAYLVDWLIRWAILAVLFTFAVGLGGLAQGLILIAYFVLEWLYPVAFEMTRRGATPGKRLMGLRVVMDTGQPVTLGASLTRNLLRAADFLPGFYGAGAVAILLRRDSKRLGDMAAGTLVVFDHSADLDGRLPEADILDPGRALTLPEQAVIVALAGRHGRLTPQRFDELARMAGSALPDTDDRATATRRLLGVAQWAVGRHPYGAPQAPRQFEIAHAPGWAELDTLVTASQQGKRHEGARLAALYRQACGHLALAQSRAYPAYLVRRLETLVQRAHTVVYRPRGAGRKALGRFLLIDFPQAVRTHWRYVLASALLFSVPLLVLGVAAALDRDLASQILGASQVREFDDMYRGGAEALGRKRDAGDDWTMFGFYIMNNIGIGFQCFASGIFAGVGSVFFIVYNGASIGLVGGYMVAAGHSANFYSFVATHAAFELTAIVLAGAAGLMIGHAWLAPGTLTRLEALKRAAGQAVVLVYGVTAMLLVAAAIEAFWSSSRWIEPSVKYSVAAACWLLVIGYLGWQGRPRRDPAPGQEAAHAGR
ncbi:stage II sporulation protein M [Bordetella genomosp. 13]|uniref:stage II sporulation protein M n=1 Tax=Bordetella genomosp. 13 TaxID=463040 RepID=UPI0021B6DF6B|nr:stage II sporulation protein M [Bordetella genomosp. 13]